MSRMRRLLAEARGFAESERDIILLKVRRPRFWPRPANHDSVIMILSEPTSNAVDRDRSAARRGQPDRVPVQRFHRIMFTESRGDVPLPA